MALHCTLFRTLLLLVGMHIPLTHVSCHSSHVNVSVLLDQDEPYKLKQMYTQFILHICLKVYRRYFLDQATVSLSYHLK
jgi:hypothetical protein